LAGNKPVPQGNNFGTRRGGEATGKEPEGTCFYQNDARVKGATGAKRRLLLRDGGNLKGAGVEGGSGATNGGVEPEDY